MRAAGLVLTVVSLSSIGCTALIAESGAHLPGLKDRAAVRAAFGPPTATGEAGGQPFEEYITRRKIADTWLVAEMVWCYSRPFVWLGLPSGTGMVDRLVAENPDLAAVFFFPQELYLVGRRTVRGQRIRFTYDADGTVADVSLDGEPAFPLRPTKSKWPPPER